MQTGVSSASSLTKGPEDLSAFQPFVVYRVGDGSLASPLNDVAAIVPLTGFFPLGQPGDTFVGVMPWRGRSVNLLNVAALMGDAQATADSCRDVLIVMHQAGQTETYHGFLVSHVESLTSAALEPAPLLNRPEIPALPKERNVDFSDRMIRVTSGDSRRNFSVLDLAQLARFIGEGQPSSPAAEQAPALSLS